MVLIPFVCVTSSLTFLSPGSKATSPIFQANSSLLSSVVTVVAAVVAAVADSSYKETDDTQGGTNIVLDVANQPTKYQNKMLVIILGIGILAIAIITILTIKRKKDSEM